MKKILMIVNHDVVIYNFRRELVERLINDGFEVYISSPYGERIDKLIEIGCKYIKSNISRHGTNPIQDIKLFLHYRKIIKIIKPEVVLTYTIKPNIYGGLACRSLGVRYIANITGLGTAVENPGLMQSITLNLYKIAFKKIQCVFFQNEENKKFFEDKKICNSRFRLLPGSGVNLEHFKLLEYPDDETIEFVFISRIMKEKGIEQYLEAAKYIRKKYPNTVFHICGFCEENYEKILRDLEKEKVIKYHGMKEDIREILKITHCTIHPTYYPEGMSNVLLESAASGRPIITTNRSGCKEAIIDEVNGYIVEIKNTKHLIRTIEKFIKLKYEAKVRMGLLGREKMATEFDRNIVIESYIEEIERKIGIYE